MRWDLNHSGPWLLAAMASLLVACAQPGPRPEPLAMRPLEDLGLSAQTSSLHGSWWSTLADPQLDALITRALQDQPSLAASRARVTQALALAGQTESTLSPQLGLSADLNSQRYSARGLVPPPVAGQFYSSGTLQLGLGWAPDFFGQHAADLARALGQARAAQADSAAAANALAAQVGHGYVALARLLTQQDLARLKLQQARQLLQLVSERVRAGLDTRLEQTQAEGTVAQVQTQIEALDEQVQLLRQQLAVLSGQAPQALAGLNPRLDGLKLAPVPEVLGLDLLGRRPEVLAARWRVQAASQGVNVARAEFYPNINLNAFVGLNALGLDRLLSTRAEQYGVSPALRLPLFDGGRLRAQLRGREAELDAAVALYNRTVLDAVKEASDALAAVQSLQRQQALQAQSLSSAQTARQLAQERFAAGMGNVLLVLAAESQVLAEQATATELRARQLDARLSLMSALSGGMDDEAAVKAGAPVQALR